MVWYLDTSALVKLLVHEDGSDAMRAWWKVHGPFWSSHLLVTEATRTATRLGIPDDSLTAALETVSLVMPVASTFLLAGTLLPMGLRTLDALHLASALEMGADLEGLVTYDDRLAEGAAAAGVSVVVPR